MFGIDDAIGLGISAVGLGMQLFGGSSQASISKQMAQVSQDEAAHEQKINDYKSMQMEMEARRSMLQTVRNEQRARAMGVAASTNQGANLGSGLQGGIASTMGQGIFDLQGINQALGIGRNINTENDFISQDKIKMAGLQGKSAEAQGWQSLGGSMMKAGGIFGQFAGNLSGSNNGSISVGNYNMPTIGYKV